jgi:hypothetical protein
MPAYCANSRVVGRLSWGSQPFANHIDHKHGAGDYAHDRMLMSAGYQYLPARFLLVQAQPTRPFWHFCEFRPIQTTAARGGIPDQSWPSAALQDCPRAPRLRSSSCAPSPASWPAGPMAIGLRQDEPCERLRREARQAGFAVAPPPLDGCCLWPLSRRIGTPETRRSLKGHGHEAGGVQSAAAGQEPEVPSKK